MPCPTCSHTLAHITAHDDMAFKHCERCGTLVVFISTPGHEPRVYVPKLVDRCRAFRKTLGADHMSQFQSCRENWHRLGIDESIHTVADRRREENG